MLGKHRTRYVSGFVAVAGLLLAVSCSRPGSSEGLGGLPKSVGAADETSAIQTLRTVATAQAQSKVIKGSYGDFNALAQAGYLDARFAATTPVTRGYRFTMTVTDAEFSVNADPEPAQSPANSRSRHLYLDSSDSVIHVNPNQAASKNDPAL